MQTATILYLTHAHPAEQSPLGPEAARAAGLDPEWTELAEGGPRTLNEAALRLAARGAGRVEAVPCRAEGDGTLRLGRPRLRLLG